MGSERDALRHAEVRAKLAERLKEAGAPVSAELLDLGVLVSTAYPALAQALLARPDDLVALFKLGTKTARDARIYRKAMLSSLGDLSDSELVRSRLRRFAHRAKLRIAARELLDHDVDVTARELSDLADVCIEVALAEAELWATERFGVPLTAEGKRCAFTVIGMGKLGGRELNAGSDVDLLMFYETDDGEVKKGDDVSPESLHGYFTRITQRLTKTLDDTTEDGIAWRVDLRLRPEGSRGPLVNSLAAAEQYYETWGRTWERAALVRARPVAGDLAFGKKMLEALFPFVWRREVNPRIAHEMIQLVRRARAELRHDAERDLKLGTGGIREAEFFVQSLQLIWGGRQPSIRSSNTLVALRRLRARGLVTDREGREVADDYLTLRRVEHRIQFATGLQTHVLPKGPMLETIARSLGHKSGAELEKDLQKTRARVSARLSSLLAETDTGTPPTSEYDPLLAAIAGGDESEVQEALSLAIGPQSPDFARHLLALARHPDYPLGSATLDRNAELGPLLVRSLVDAADPDQAARLLAAFFARVPTPAIYVKAMTDDPAAVRGIVGLLGASAFLGEALVAHPELTEVFSRASLSADVVRAALEGELAASDSSAEDPGEAFVGALRRAKRRVTMDVGVADLAGEVGTRAATLVLSDLADETLERATAYAMAEKHLDRGLAVIAMGKLGGREIGYGSDLDIFFVYDGLDEEKNEAYVRTAQRVLRLLSTPHGDGPGYELDTRLRPSGNHGLLVVSLPAFARYHGIGVAIDQDELRAEDWERQALIRARVCAGDRALGAKVLAIAHEAAYERGAPPPEKVHRLRMRMEHELTAERLYGDRRRYDLKVGRGGIVDVEFSVQWLQMKHGHDRRVRSTETETALAALEACGYMSARDAETLREGYVTLRRLEQRLRVLHGTSAQLIEEGAPGLALLARRMGLRDGVKASAAQALLARYESLTLDVRNAYARVLGVSLSASE